jgi:hypothetical protein
MDTCRSPETHTTRALHWIQLNSQLVGIEPGWLCSRDLIHSLCSRGAYRRLKYCHYPFKHKSSVYCRCVYHLHFGNL